MSQRTLHRLLWGILLAVMAGIAGASVWSGLGVSSKPASQGKRALEGLQTFGLVPDFSLIERSGSRISLAELKGKVWIANFIYTTCQDTCPLQSAEMAKLQEEIGNKEGLRLVSISVDPERDNPETLSRYAHRFNADPNFWLFLTGNRKDIYHLAQEGFRLSAVPVAEGAEKNQQPILHSSRFVLVDDQTRIRGYYDSQDAEALQRLRRDVKKLLIKAEA